MDRRERFGSETQPEIVTPMELVEGGEEDV